MIPYLEIPSLPIYGALEIRAFGVLVALGILIGADRTRMRARQLGLSDARVSSMITWVVLIGFVVAHLFQLIAYQPNLFRRPVGEILFAIVDIRRGISSFGGFLGALVTLVVFVRYRPLPLLATADALLFGLAYGWVFGRAGCYTAHDHPGRYSDFFLAVRYPDGARHDLGFDEMLYTLALAATFHVLSLRVRRNGLYAAIACITYGPVRFGLDFLRVTGTEGADPRYAGLTPAQWGSLAVFIVGVVLAVMVARRPKEEPAKAPPELEKPQPEAGGRARARSRAKS